MESVQQEEEQIREEAQRIAEKELKNKQLAYRILPILIAISIALFIHFYRKSRPSQTLDPNLLKTDYGLPSDHKPALISTLLNYNSVAQAALTSTLLDLARCGYLRLNHVKTQKSFMSDKEVFEIILSDQIPDILDDWEVDLLNFLRQRSEEDITRLDKIFSKTPKKVSKWFRHWSKLVKSSYDKLNLYDAHSKQLAIKHAVFQTLILLGCIPLFVWGGPPVIAGLFIILALDLLSLIIYRRTLEGEQLYRAWYNLRIGWKKNQVKLTQQSQLIISLSMPLP